MEYIKQQWRNNSTTMLLGLGLVAVILVFGFVYMNNKKEGILKDAADRSSQTGFTSSHGNPIVTLKTSMGDIVLELYADKTPITVGNFLTLAQDGFYNGTKFHRVIKDFMIQGGDPNTKGDDESIYGRGGPGYTIEDEFRDDLSNVRGTIAMANIGQPHTGGSQFFINYADNVFLDYDKEPPTSRHPVFGHVIAGMDVVDAISRVPTKEPGMYDIPIEPVILYEVMIELPATDIEGEEPQGDGETDAMQEAE